MSLNAKEITALRLKFHHKLFLCLTCQRDVSIAFKDLSLLLLSFFFLFFFSLHFFYFIFYFLLLLWPDVITDFPPDQFCISKRLTVQIRSEFIYFSAPDTLFCTWRLKLVHVLNCWAFPYNYRHICAGFVIISRLNNSKGVKLYVPTATW